MWARMPPCRLSSRAGETETLAPAVASTRQVRIVPRDDAVHSSPHAVVQIAVTLPILCACPTALRCLWLSGQPFS